MKMMNNEDICKEAVDELLKGVNHGGKRNGSGRKPTGRKKLIVYVTDEEAKSIRNLIQKMRIFEAMHAE
jgi:hypothetical protein